VLAASSGHGVAGSVHATSFADLSIFFVNFAIYFCFLLLVLRKPLKKVFAQRHEQVLAAVEKGTHQLEQAKQAVVAAEAKLSAVESSLGQMRSEAEREAEREAQELLADAKQKALQTLQQANELASAETRATERELRRQLVEQVVERARQLLLKSNTSELDAARRRHAATLIAQSLQ
jgi:F-type H+-transporting ATPase subunit b